MMLPPSTLPKSSDGSSESSSSGLAVSSYKRLWVHEVFRVFYDRLVDAADRTWLMTQLKATISKHFGDSLDGLMSHLLPAGQQEVGPEEMRRWDTW